MNYDNLTEAMLGNPDDVMLVRKRSIVNLIIEHGQLARIVERHNATIQESRTVEHRASCSMAQGEGGTACECGVSK